MSRGSVGIQVDIGPASRDGIASDNSHSRKQNGAKMTGLKQVHFVTAGLARHCETELTDGRRLPLIDGKSGRPYDFTNEIWAAGRGDAARGAQLVFSRVATALKSL